MPDQQDQTQKGGTMRLGAYECKLKKGTRAQLAYGEETVYERHRHRYEFNNTYRDTFEQHGMTIAGVHPTNSLAEIVELTDHPWFVAVQFHPELKSRPRRPHPLFRELVKHSLLLSGSSHSISSGS
jgi:CTP synthase